MLTITKTLKFDAAHLLSGYDGKCRNLHGHTYRVDVSVAGERGADGMVLDFGKVKAIAEDIVIGRLDHAFLYDRGAAAEREIASSVERLGLRTIAFDFPTTSENLAKFIFNELKDKLSGLVAVKVWETADNCAEERI